MKGGSKPTNKNLILRELIAQFPKISKSALARKAVDMYPTLFDVENARTMIRALTNAAGKNNAAGPVHYEAPELPASRASERKFFRVGATIQNV